MCKVTHTFLKFWIAEEEIIAGSGWGCLASIWLEDTAQYTADLIELAGKCDDTFLEKPVSRSIVTDVKFALQISTMCASLYYVRNDTLSRTIYYIHLFIFTLGIYT